MSVNKKVNILRCLVWGYCFASFLPIIPIGSLSVTIATLHTATTKNEFIADAAAISMVLSVASLFAIAVGACFKKFRLSKVYMLLDAAVACIWLCVSTILGNFGALIIIIPYYTLSFIYIAVFINKLEKYSE